MSTGAIIMMIVSIVLIWGGLAAAIIQLRRHPDRSE
ncbi:MAG: methionine/alanine import family NSS transporter small subunit [Actinophytocola sp.]|nr:methionine/alanine import family NSS transporter small subunit [Actinophytocola sp.]